MLVKKLHFFVHFLIFYICRSQLRTFVNYKPSRAKLSIRMSWLDLPAEYDDFQLTYKQSNESVGIVNAFSRGERTNPLRIVGTGFYSLLTLEGIVDNRARTRIPIENVVVPIPPLPPVNATFSTLQGQNLTIRLTKQDETNLVSQFVIRCFSSPDSSCTGQQFVYQNDPNQDVQNVVIPNLQSGTNYTFAVSTISHKMNSTSSFITTRYTGLKVPLPLVNLLICEFPYKPGILLTLVKNRASIQDYFYVKCESPDDVEHECTKGEGLQVWDSKDPDELELNVPITGLNQEVSYTFSAKPVSGSHIGQAAIIRNYKFADGKPGVGALQGNGTKHSTTTVHSDSIFHTHANGKAHIGRGQTEIPAEVAVASALAGLVVGILGTFFLSWLLTRNSSEPADNQTESVASIDPDMLQPNNQRQQQISPRLAPTKSAPPLKKISQSNRRLAVETKSKHRYHQSGSAPGFN